jgi:Condensation domain
MADRILVAFDGDGAGVDTLSWGQCEIWRSMTAVGMSFNLAGAYPVAPGTTVADVAELLRFAVSRHQSLRTRIVVDPDGTVRQVVSAAGEVPLEIFDVDAAKAADEAADVLERYELTIFDYPNEWPVRMAVVCADGVPAHMVVSYCHVATDVHGLHALVADTQTMHGTPQPVTATQPLQQVARQREKSALRQSDAALRHAERLLRTIPGREPGRSTDRRDPRWWQVGYDSPASYPAVLAIAARNRVPTTPVLLAGFAVALCRATDTTTAVTRLMVNNRFRPGLAGSVSPLAQTCLAVIEIGDGSFDEIVGRAWRAATLAGKNAYFDPDRMAELIRRIGRERDADLHVDVCFNDRRRGNLTPGIDRLPTPAELAGLRAAGAVRWERSMAYYDHSIYFHVNDVPDTFDYLLCADTHHLSPADMASMVRCVEDVFVTAAFGPA